MWIERPRARAWLGAGSMTSERRPLGFARLDQIMAEVDRLLASGYEAQGAWSLGQVCRHLSDVLRYSIEGFPKRAPWVVRRLMGPVLKRRVLASGRYPEGVRLAGPGVPPSGLDDRAEAEALRAAILLLDRHAGDWAEHPVLGRLDRPEWVRLHCLHAAHHLGLLRPREGG